MNRWLALKVFKIDKETSGLVIIKNKSLMPWRALGFILNNHQAIGLYLLLKSSIMECEPVFCLCIDWKAHTIVHAY